MKHVRVLDMEKGAQQLTVHPNATLNDVLAAAGTSQGDHALSQNGRPAKGTDLAKEDATVMLMPRAHHA